MKLQVSDIKKTKFYTFLPKEFSYLNDGQYLSFYYLYDDSKSKIVDIKNINVANSITSLMYKGRPFTKDGTPYAIGGIVSPFDTQQTFFYLFLKYYCEKDVQASKDLLDFFLKAKASDLESVSEKMKATTFENSFEIVTRDNFSTALDRYLFCNTQITTTVLQIVDTIDSYYRRKKDGKSIFYNCIERIVTGMPMPQGGLMPEKNGVFEYLYVGEKSELIKDDEQLRIAKDMFRNQFSISEIYAKTGWFFNQKDTRWRKLIDDSEATIGILQSRDSVYITNTSTFVNQQENVFRLMGGIQKVDFDYAGIASLFNNGWDVVLGDVLHHPTLYKHYPSLYKIPIFFANNSKTKKEVGAYNFFFSPVGFLVIMGNPDEWDLRTVLLHEVQHAIQDLEGFSQGGSMGLADMIMAIGGENVKKYVFLREKITELFVSGATVSGKYSYGNYSEFQKPWTKYIKSVTENDYYRGLKNVADTIIGAYLQLVKDNDARIRIAKFLGKDCESILKEIDDILNKAENRKFILNQQGYSGQEIESIFFSMYESLGGEIESRDVEHTSMLDPELKGYSLPQSSEYIEEGKITSIFKGMFSGVPQNIVGGCENVGDGKYIIHLFDSSSPEPILHELGHILYDLVEPHTAVPKADMILPSGKFDPETFCELLMCYFVRQDINPRFTRSIAEGRKLMEWTFMDETFDSIFKHKDDFDETDKKLVDMLSYMKGLNNSLDRGDDNGAAIKYEEDIYQALEEMGEMDRSDAQGIAMPFEEYIKEQISMGTSANEIAAEILAKTQVITLPGFIEKIKGMFKVGNKWHFVNEKVNGHEVKIKFFTGAKEIDVQIFTIDNLTHSLSGNYMGKRETLNQLIEKFNAKLASPLDILDTLDKLEGEISEGLKDLRDMLSDDFTEVKPVNSVPVVPVIPKEEVIPKEVVLSELKTKEDVLKNCAIEGNVVKLPNVPLDRKLYVEVAKTLELIGGKWKGGKVMGFVFNEDPTNLLIQVSGGEKRNLKKEFQFFATPDGLSDEVVQLANIQPTDKVLEPSAGQGSIVKAVHRKIPNIVIDYCEFMPSNQIFMKRLPNVNMVGDDFLALPLSFKYDKIVANPPFAKNQDVTHVQKMYDHLKPGGRLVSITSPHWKHSSNKKETEFRNWLTEVGATIKEIPAGTFKESGTTTATMILVIDKSK